MASRFCVLSEFLKVCICMHTDELSCTHMHYTANYYSGVGQNGHIQCARHTHLLWELGHQWRISY